MGTLTLRLAESLVVRSVTAPGLGRLLTLRVKGQNSVIVNLPRVRGARRRAGAHRRLCGPAAGRRRLSGRPSRSARSRSSRTRWACRRSRGWSTPTAATGIRRRRSTDFATATLRLTMPENHAVRRERHLGVRQPGPRRRSDAAREAQAVRLRGRRAGALLRGARSRGSRPRPRRRWRRPRPGARRALTKPDDRRRPRRRRLRVAPLAADDPRQPAPDRARARHAGTGARGLVGLRRHHRRVPVFRRSSLALVDDPLPGGHSPAYFALLHQPLPTSPYSWRNDPVSFDNFPQFFLAHEIAHQFWGNAVGWENYHEQWISEGVRAVLRGALRGAHAIARSDLR